SNVLSCPQCPATLLSWQLCKIWSLIGLDMGMYTSPLRSTSPSESMVKGSRNSAVSSSRSIVGSRRYGRYSPIWGSVGNVSRMACLSSAFVPISDWRATAANSTIRVELSRLRYRPGLGGGMLGPDYHAWLFPRSLVFLIACRVFPL